MSTGIFWFRIGSNVPVVRWRTADGGVTGIA